MNGTQHVLRDESLEDEIELVGELVVAATVSDGPLTQEQIDQVLGVDGPDDAGSQDAEDAEDAEDAAGATGPGA